MFFAAEPDHREGNAAGVGVYKGIAQNVSRPLRRFAPRFCSCGAKLRLRFASKGRLQISAQGDTWGRSRRGDSRIARNERISLAIGGRAMRAPTRLWEFCNTIPRRRCFVKYGQKRRRGLFKAWKIAFGALFEGKSLDFLFKILYHYIVYE